MSESVSESESEFESESESDSEIKIYINYSDEYCEDLLQFLTQYSNNFELLDISCDEEGCDEVKLMVYYGLYKFKFNEIEYTVDYNCEGKIISCPHGPDKKKNIVLICNFFHNKLQNIDAIKQLLLHIKTKNRPLLKEYIRVYISNNANWDKLNIIPKRSLETIFINNKNNIIEDIINFMKNQAIYLEKGIKYKRNYLLYGPSGTGKTSFISAIASKYNHDIFMISLLSLNDTHFMKLIAKLPERALLVLEDIDCVFNEREIYQNNQLSFSTILNTLDGFACKTKLITFMTTNYKNKLDKALTRPGRIDYILEFDYAVKDQLKEMFLSYFNDINLFNDLYSKIKEKKMSTAAFYKFLFENRDESDIISKLDILNNLTEQYKGYQNMYI